jgi:hypothetical protein
MIRISTHTHESSNDISIKNGHQLPFVKEKLQKADICCSLYSGQLILAAATVHMYSRQMIFMSADIRVSRAIVLGVLLL